MFDNIYIINETKNTVISVNVELPCNILGLGEERAYLRPWGLIPMVFISPGNWGLLNCPSAGNGPRWSFGYTVNLGPPGGTTEDRIFPGYGGGGRLKIWFKLSCCQCWRGAAWAGAAASCKAFSWRTAFFFCCCCCRIISRNFWRCFKKKKNHGAWYCSWRILKCYTPLG